MPHVMIRFDRLAEGHYQKTMPRAFDEAFVADHGTLCRAFSLDPIRTKFDLPSSWRGTGSDRGDGRTGPRIRQGMVLFHDGRDYEPIGTLTIMREGEKVRDVDPMDPREHYNLSNRL
jgi:hypothetical protein